MSCRATGPTYKLFYKNLIAPDIHPVRRVIPDIYPILVFSGKNTWICRVILHNLIIINNMGANHEPCHTFRNQR